jgi:hypothetical protein
MPQTFSNEYLVQNTRLGSFSIAMLTVLMSTMAVGCSKPQPERRSPEEILQELTQVDSDSPNGEEKTIATQAEKLLSDKANTNNNEMKTTPASDSAQTDNAVLVIDAVPEQRKRSLPVEDVNTSPWIFDSSRPLETWEVIYRGNVPVGYTSKKSVPDNRGSETLIKTDLRSVLRFAKDGKEIRQELIINSVERPNGELVSLTTKVQTGSDIRMLVARVDGSNMEAELITNNNKQKNTVAWDNNLRGPFAIEQSMMRKPMKDNESRLVKFLDPMSSRIVETRLDAQSKYKTPVMLGKSRLMLEIKAETRDGNVLSESTLWSDEDGVILKSYVQASDLRIFRVDEDTYTDVEGGFDLSFSAKRSLPLSIKPDKLEVYRKALEIENLMTYRFQLRQSDPHQSLSNRSYQRKKSLDAFTSEITVIRLTDREEFPVGVETNDNPTTSDLDLISLVDPNNPIFDRVCIDILPQADNGDVHLKVQAIAKRLSEKYESVGFNNEVRKLTVSLSTNRLNSVEHAMALIALLRKEKIPARMAIGFAYDRSASQPSMVFQAWVEYHHAEWWWPIDPIQPSETRLLDRIKTKEISSFSFDIRREIKQVLEFGNEATISVQD